MHTTVFGKDDDARLVHYNGDFSGDVLIEVPRDNVRASVFDPVDRVTVAVPFDVLKALVAEQKRNRLITDLEQADDDEILKDW